MGMCVREREAMAAAQGRYAPIIRAILKSAWGAIPLSRSPAPLALFCHLSSLYSPLLNPPPHLLFLLRLPSNLLIFSPTVTPQLSSRFLTLGNMREISPPLEFRGPAGSACHHLKIISLLTQTVWTKANSYHSKFNKKPYTE